MPLPPVGSGDRVRPRLTPWSCIWRSILDTEIWYFVHEHEGGTSTITFPGVPGVVAQVDDPLAEELPAIGRAIAHLVSRSPVLAGAFAAQADGLQKMVVPLDEEAPCPVGLELFSDQDGLVVGAVFLASEKDLSILAVARMISFLAALSGNATIVIKDGQIESVT